MARRVVSDEERRELLEAAARLFEQHGFIGTSVKDLLAHTGATRAALTAHFHSSSKEGVALAVAEHMASQWPSLIGRFAVLRAPALDTVVALTLEFAERCRNDIVVRAGLRLAVERDGVKVALPHALAGWEEQIEWLLSPAGERELMGLSVGSDAASRVIVQCLLGVVHICVARRSCVDMPERITEMWTVLMPGLRPTPDPAARIAAAQAIREKLNRTVAEDAPRFMPDARVSTAEQARVGGTGEQARFAGTGEHARLGSGEHVAVGPAVGTAAAPKPALAELRTAEQEQLDREPVIGRASVREPRQYAGARPLATEDLWPDEDAEPSASTSTVDEPATTPARPHRPRHLAKDEPEHAPAAPKSAEPEPIEPEPANV